MRILLDESVPVQVRHALPAHKVQSVSDLGWKGRGNGDLLQAAEAAGFEVFILADKNLRYQQNLSGRRLTIIELWTNHRPTLERHQTLISDAITAAKPGAYVVVVPNRP